MSARQSPIRIGISSCLLGERVRWDGDHKQDSYIRRSLGELFEFVPVCPEVGIGLGVPRPPIRLVGDPEAPRLVGVEDADLDVTGAMQRFGRRQARHLGDLDGYIFKSKSPSCGMKGVKLHTDQGMKRQGVGLYAREFMAANPLIPCEEDDRLGDPALRDNWLERVFTWHRWRQLRRRWLTARRLADFHARHRLAIMTHGQASCRALDDLIARIGTHPLPELADRYIVLLMETLKRRATPRRHSNVLHRLMGHLKHALSPEDRQELLELIDAYRLGKVPRTVPLTLLKHHFRKHPHPDVTDQTYLNPGPAELRLRSFY